MDYRREIDGLRALAVLPVILFHAGIESFSGGFIGVDVFFVISGYLITSIILLERENDSFSIINFYERRARRIIPALFLVLLFSCILSWFWLTPHHMKNFSQSVVSVIFFASNFLFWHESGYWGFESELKPLLHTWSLAVEEQYYVMFPIFIAIMWRFSKKWLLISFIIIAITSLSLAQWLSIDHPISNFFLLPTRAWELAIGAIIAYSFIYHKRALQSILKSTILNNALSLVGLLLVLLSIILINEDTPFPSVYALLPTIGTALIIIFASDKNFLGKFLGTKLLVQIGLISYSAYLWHQPFFAFLRHRSLSAQQHYEYLILGLLSLFQLEIC